MAQRQGDLTGEPANNPESPFDVEETDETDDRAGSKDRPERNASLSDFGSSGQSTLCGYEDE